MSKHKLIITRKGKGAQKEEYICIKCGQRFAYYLTAFPDYPKNKVRAIEEHVNKYYNQGYFKCEKGKNAGIQ